MNAPHTTEPGDPRGPRSLRHDLRTPINHIMGYAELLLEVVEEEGPAVLREQAGADAHRLASLIQEDGRELLTMIHTELASASEGSATEREVLGERISVRLRTVQEHTRAFVQLVSNADSWVDPGADPQTLFLNDLQRIHHASNQMQLLTQQHLLAGSVNPQLASAVSEGEEASKSQQPTSGSSALPQQGSHSKWGRLLVVDDNPANRDLLCRRLEHEGYQTATAENGRQALSMIGTRSFDLVLLDVLMPEMDGYEVLAKVKENPDLRDIPIIMISALDELQSVVRCIEQGAEDYLPKPFDPVILRARLGACLEKKRLRDKELEYLTNVAAVQQAAAAIEAGTFEIESLTEVARRSDELGRLARVFQSMARQVQARERKWKAQVQELQIQIDEARKSHQVEEITSTDYFQDLKSKAASLRRRAGKEDE